MRLPIYRRGGEPMPFVRSQRGFRRLIRSPCEAPRCSCVFRPVRRGHRYCSNTCRQRAFQYRFFRRTGHSYRYARVREGKSQWR